MMHNAGTSPRKCLELRAGWSLLLLSWLCATQSFARVQDLEISQPRDYGYLLGDVVVQRVRVVLPDGYELQRGNLAEPGRLDRWLWLQGFDAVTEPGGTRLEWRYQLLSASAQPQRIVVPEKTLRFANEEDTTLVTIEPFVLWAQPIAYESSDNPAFMEIQPALAPPPLTDRLHLLGMGAGAVLVLLGGVSLAYVFGAVPGLRRSKGPFAVALSRISSETRRGNAEAYEAGLKHLHRAFDITAGRVLLPRDLAGFFVEHDEFRVLQDRIQSFYDTSQEYFFRGDGRPAAGTEQWRELRALCRSCRDVERGLLR